MPTGLNDPEYRQQLSARNLTPSVCWWPSNRGLDQLGTAGTASVATQHDNTHFSRHTIGPSQAPPPAGSASQSTTAQQRPSGCYPEDRRHAYAQLEGHLAPTPASGQINGLSIKPASLPQGWFAQDQLEVPGPSHDTATCISSTAGAISSSTGHQAQSSGGFQDSLVPWHAWPGWPEGAAACVNEFPYPFALQPPPGPPDYRGHPLLGDESAQSTGCAESSAAPTNSRQPLAVLPGMQFYNNITYLSAPSRP